MNEIELIIPGRPVPKPRMTRKDKYLNPPRKIVSNYREYSTKIQAAYMKEASKGKKGFVKFKVAALWVRFYFAGSLNKMDIDNVIKSIKDSLTRAMAVPDDTMEYFRRYDGVEVIPLCDTCARKGKCNDIMKCKDAATVIRIREMPEDELEELRYEAYKRQSG